MLRAGVVLSALLVVSLACGSNDDGAASRATLRVFAASSLTEAFTELGGAFEAEHPGVTVTLNFAASSALARQIEQRAPADVFVSADESTMQKVVATGDASEPTVIARNRLAIAVEKGNPKGIRSLADLATPDTIVVLCAPEVPCGRYAAVALAKAGVRVEPASLEENVKAVVTKVALGEADAGIVYVTDLRAATDVEGVAIAGADAPDLLASYPAAVLERAGDPALARAWVDYLTTAAQRTLRRFGFLSP